MSVIEYKNLSYDLVKAKRLQNGDTILIGTKLFRIDDIRFCSGMGHFEYGEYVTVSGVYSKREVGGWIWNKNKKSSEDFYLYKEQPVIKVTNSGYEDG